jgi:hypothetical protein
MKKTVSIALIAISICLTSCTSDDAKFKITKDAIGLLTKEVKVTDLETIYAQDSIVTDTGIPKINGSINDDPEVKIDSIGAKKSIINPNFSYRKVEIYEKGGQPLLSLTPTNDVIATIENIRFLDPRFTTEKGISTQSTFKDIKEKYEIKKIITSMNNIVILIKDNGLYFTIDKKELPESLRYNSSLNIEEVQIPDDAKIKYMMMAWE